MKHYTIETIDHKRYKPTIEIQVVGGSRPRVTLVHKDTKRRYLFKTYSHNPREVWAECLASNLGQVLRIDIQKVMIKKASSIMTKLLREHYSTNLPSKWTPVGTLARDIFKKHEEILYGDKIVGTKSDALSLNGIATSISSQYYAPEDLLQTFAEMVIFDALIGNMDRHHENWGIVETLKYKQQLLFDKKQLVNQRHFVPLYDHGSSLLFELGEDRIQYYLDQPEQFKQKYILGSPYSFLRDNKGDRENVFQVIEESIQQNNDWGKRFRKAISKVCTVSELDLAKAIIKMPNAAELDYSESRKKLLLKSLLMRHDILRGMLK